MSTMIWAVREGHIEMLYSCSKLKPYLKAMCTKEGPMTIRAVKMEQGKSGEHTNRPRHSGRYRPIRLPFHR